jgi:RND family efflux transporter MFP subunit
MPGGRIRGYARVDSFRMPDPLITRFPRSLTPPVAIAAGLCVLLCASCSKSDKVEARQPQAPQTVAVARASVEDMSNALALTAEFKPFQEVDVMAKVAGYVKNINVDVGDRVQQGQLLAVLEIPEMADDLARGKAAVDRSQAEVARARDELRRAESSHDIAHLSYTRLSEVSKQRPGLVAQQEVDDSHSKDLVADAQLSAAKSALTGAQEQVQVNQAELKRVQTMLDYTRVSAPFAGVITKRYADTGSMLQAGTASNTQALPLVKLSENSLLRLIVPVPESAVPTVHIGQQVEVRVPTLDRTFPGRVARFSEKVQAATRTMDTEVDVANPTLVLIPGMYAEVNLTLDRHPRALAVPIQAVDLSSDDASGQVALVTPENRIEFRPVKLGIQTASSVEVKSGLKDGDMVVVGARTGLKAGQEVQPKVSGGSSK